MKELVSIKEASKLLGVGPATLRKWEQKGALVPFRNPINNYRVYKLSTIEDFLNKMAMERLKKTKLRLSIKIGES